MGVTFGKIEATKFKGLVLQEYPVRIRSYAGCFVAEIAYTEETLHEANEALLNYIGYNTTPQNLQGSSVPGVVEVVDARVKIEPVVPLLRQENVLQLILPASYVDIDTIPIPTDKRITIKSVSARTVAISTFHGRGTRSEIDSNVRLLREKLEAEHLLGGSLTVVADPIGAKVKHGELLSTPTEAEQAITKDVATLSENRWVAAQYHSHSTLSFLRKNEVWIELDHSNLEVQRVEQIAAQKETDKPKP